ncbi:replication initiator protein A, N-terminal domain protein [Staphylococcus epidermidis VCU120]|jgi:DnaD/phage-associated family protein|uniref:replication initiator protein A n=1 Tax=Staphylococcus epidermidis TaxID=1282 RepID=UPI00024E20DF|nr:replication initiator protein A [Staphylococcus epidermidis]EHR84365.1 replication initiator protein A, N-terminal domain protein [Staphylococcus epidermidis VCU120]MCG2134994.1 replication initiator protein A [Staphylococcus epidermidis]MDU5112484.1 replication initiator protein A [Staphylococcus epidermidis]PIH06451.1 replication protein [Staphylococcus epidermidis]
MIEKRFNIQEQFRAKFYQLPKVLFTNEKYMKLSNDAKVAYAILQDRLELSIKNEWFNEHGDIYFIYTNEKLKEILNCQNSKLSKIKNELISVDLLEQIRTGQGKPNQLYLNRPIIETSDVYKIKNQESDVAEDRHDKDVRKSDVKKSENQTSRNPKIGRLEIRKSDANNTKFSQTEFIETELNDTTTTRDQYSSSSNISKWVNRIQIEFQIKITKKYKEQLEDLLVNFNDEVINHAIEYSSEQGNNPKTYLLKVLQNWKEANINTVEEAKAYSVKPKKHTQSREKTPEWLEDRDNKNNDLKEENDPKFEEERKAFLEQLQKDWEE